MNFNSSPDEPTLRRGSSLTPESPRPIHLPEPSNIPVLQNQIDPVFNLMSTHLEPPYALRDLTAMDLQASKVDETPKDGPLPDRPLQDETLRDEPLQHPRQKDSLRNNHLPHELQHEPLAMDMSLEFVEAQADPQADPQADARPQCPGKNKISNGMSLSEAGIETEVEESSPLINLANLSAQTDEGFPTTSFDQVPTTESSLDSMPSNHSLILDSSQSISISHEPIDTPITMPLATTTQSLAPPAPPVIHSAISGSNENVIPGEVDIQAMLDNIVAPTLSTIGTTHLSLNGNASSSADYSQNAASSLISSASVILPASAGLPPRPPPQEKPAIHPNYAPGEDIRSYHFPPAHHTSAPSNQTQQTGSFRSSQSYGAPVSGIPPASLPGANGLPPPPMPSFQQPLNTLDNGQPTQQRQHGGMGTMGIGRPAGIAPGHTCDGEHLPGWGSDVQRKYEEFLDDERIYTAEGTWEKFPPGSRLFVGNLPSEVVSKRNVFNIFHKYGRLAQISIKQAYGFVQFLEASACYAALNSEQGGRLAERNMHLEISKPPKNVRNAQPTAAGDSLRASYYRRSRSPEYGRGPPSRQKAPRNGADRFMDSRDEPRRRDDYRPGRSPSPRGGRGRNDFRAGRDRSPPRYYSGRSRSRSPPFTRGPQRYRSQSPRRRSIDDDDALPLPRRAPRDVPDVQLILIDELDRSFVAYVEKSFRDHGLSCATLKPPHVPLATVVKRQILEGVQAVVKLHHSSQLTGKIPLQVFDRSGGADQVRFDEYDEQEVNIAAALVLRSRATQQDAVNRKNAAPQAYGGQMQPSVQQLANTNQPNLAHLITSLDGPALQKLLGAMQPASTQATQGQDYAAILGGLGGQAGKAYPNAPPVQGYPYPPQQGPQPGPPLTANPYPYPPPNQSMPIAVPQYQPPQIGHVQNIMDQLAKWKQ